MGHVSYKLVTAFFNTLLVFFHQWTKFIQHKVPSKWDTVRTNWLPSCFTFSMYMQTKFIQHKVPSKWDMVRTNWLPSCFMFSTYMLTKFIHLKVPSKWDRFVQTGYQVVLHSLYTCRQNLFISKCRQNGTQFVQTGYRLILVPQKSV